MWTALALSLACAAAFTTRAAFASDSGGQEKQGQKGQQQAPTPEQKEAAAEAADYGAVMSELDPDQQMKLAEDFANKHPSSTRLTYVYAIAANAARQKGNLSAGIDYAEKSIKLKSDNFIALMFLATMLPQPQMLQGGVDKDKRLSEAEADANQALQILSTAPNDQVRKQPSDTDEAFAKRKTLIGADAHAALGMVHLQRALEALGSPDKAELGKAEQEYQTSLTGIDQPDPQNYYRLGEALSLEGKVDEAIAAFTKCSELSQGTALQPYADKEVQELKKKKAATPPAKP
jgi:tetratricopeptide (TPR) repeat protein